MAGHHRRVLAITKRKHVIEQEVLDDFAADRRRR
jgi:hypothetical protein